MTLTAFILAAGLGQRLLPITRHVPKPLLPLVGTPMLELVLKRITDIPITTIGINLHHKKHLIEDWVKHSDYSKNITLFFEDPILGTGGALKNAQDFLKNGPFLVHNSDILSNVDLRELLKLHISSGNIATLAVHNRPEFNSLILDSGGFLMNIIKHPHPNPPPSRERRVTENAPPIKNSNYLNSFLLASKGGHADNFPSSGGRGLRGGGIQSEKFVAFTGIAVYEPEFLQFLPEGNSSVIDAWFNAISAGHTIGTMDVSGSYWTDIGTPSSYARALMHEMRKQGENIYIHQSARGCRGAVLDGYVVIESETRILKGSALRNCISLPGAKIGMVTGQKLYENCIVGPDFIIQLSESDFYHADDRDALLIGTGGSDRRYYRVKRKGSTPTVLMQCAQHDPDFERHIAYTTFFRSCAVMVPELLDVKRDGKSALFEDLGDLSLYSWLKCPRSADRVEEMYRKVLDILILIQTTASAHVHECPLLNKRIFDYEHLRWETSYFLERFVKGVKNIRIKDRVTLESELHKLASTVDSFPKTIVHRDFQSQNIMITKGTNPRVLDYQGARIGPPAYDVVSILWDPYYRLEDMLREKLLDYYLCKVTHLTSFRAFRETLLPCRLQRHMQALGAYGFLSAVKGKNYFLKYVPEGIRLLKEDISIAKNHYPALHALIKQLGSQ